MVIPAPDDVTNGEIVRTLRVLQEEIRALRGEHVRRDLYDAHQATVRAELARIESQCSRDTERLATAVADQERELETRERERERDRASLRRQLALTAVAAAFGLLSSLILLMLR